MSNHTAPVPETQPFLAVQRGFAAHLRDPQHNPPPDDVAASRMAVYRELFFNNVAECLAGTFPVLSNTLGTDRWTPLVGGFFARHRCANPLFHQLPREFLSYLEHHGAAHSVPEYALELAHYEWLEHEVSIAQMPALPPHRADGDLLTGTPLLSPLARLLGCRYAVQNVGPGREPQAPTTQPNWLLVYRDSRDAVGFIAVNALTAQLFALLEAPAGHSGAQLLAELAHAGTHLDGSTVIEAGAKLFEQLRARDIILGTVGA